MIAASVHFFSGEPLTQLWSALLWLVTIVCTGYLMVSTWRFYSFKGVSFRARHPFRLILFIAALFALIFYFSKPVLFTIAVVYMLSGIFWRLAWLFRRKQNPPAPPAYREASLPS